MSGMQRIRPESGVGGKSAAMFRHEDAEAKRRKRSAPLPGYPKEGTLTPAEAVEYLAADPLVCLVCGRGYRHLGLHLSKSHDITSREYCATYGIPWRLNGSTGLASTSQRSQMRDGILSAMKNDAGFTKHLATMHLKSPFCGGVPKALKKQSRANRLARDVTMGCEDTMCPECGRVFKPKSYGDGRRQVHCSRRCANQNRKSAKPPRKCGGCGKTLPKGSQNNGVSRCRRCYHTRLRKKCGDPGPFLLPEERPLPDAGNSEAA